MQDDLNDYQRQLNREKESANAGYDKFIKRQSENSKLSNGSNTEFGFLVKTQVLPLVIEMMEEVLSDINNVRSSVVKHTLNKCLMAGKGSGDYKIHGFWDLEQAAFLGLQLSLDTALNPNKISHTVKGLKGDKRLLQKKSITELEQQIGKVINNQISLKIVQAAFPQWFRRTNQDSEQANKGGMKATTSQWEYRMNKAIKEFAVYLRKEGDEVGAAILENRKPWDRNDYCTIGSWILTCTIKATGLFVVHTAFRDNKKVAYLELSDAARERQGEILDYYKNYTHDLLPMLIKPQPITNQSNGGWLAQALQEPEFSPDGSIELSGKHLEFINRQARVPFQLNPFTLELMNELVERELPLGKFKYSTRQEVPTVPQMLGLDSESDASTKDYQIKNHPKLKEVKHQISKIIDSNLANAQKGLLAAQTIYKAKKIKYDDYFFIPMKYDFRGRIYSRVPFINFQANDAGRYLIRFNQKTPIDDRTEHWLKIGISNAGGNDKLCWQRRLQWFEKYREEIINVGKMINRDFRRAYEFLSQDHIEDPFCLAALANEYVKVFIERSQDFTQCFVCVDASCSGTGIFNAWRRNLNGGRMVNLIDTATPSDIYLEVWNEIKRKAEPYTFRTDHLKRLEASKLNRKMVKSVYVPASYSSPKQEQVRNLWKFNNEILKPSKLEFTEKELEKLCKLWDSALDEVSSISTVVNWFQRRTDEAIRQGANSIRFTSANGSVMTMKYPKSTAVRVNTFHYGSARYRKRQDRRILPRVDIRAMKSAVTANITHMTDAAALCEALWNWNSPFVGIHDACGMPPSRLLDEGISRLKEGLIQATTHNVWDQFRLDNGLPMEPQTSPPVIGDLDLNEIRSSNYLYS